MFEIVGIIVASLMLIGLIAFITLSCLCCKVCPCYYKKCHTDAGSTQRHPEAVTMLPTASAGATNHQPRATHAYKPDTGYQPCPAIPPTVTTTNY